MVSQVPHFRGKHLPTSSEDGVRCPLKYGHKNVKNLCIITLPYSPQNPQTACTLADPLFMLLVTFSTFLLAQRQLCTKLHNKRHFTILRGDFKYGLRIQVKRRYYTNNSRQCPMPTSVNTYSVRQAAFMFVRRTET